MQTSTSGSSKLETPAPPPASRSDLAAIGYFSPASNAQLVEATKALIAKFAFSKESAESIYRIEQICTVNPAIIYQGFGNPKDEAYDDGCAFYYHRRRLQSCYFADKFGNVYMGVRFNLNAEGPPGFAHGGALSAAADTAVVVAAAHNSERGCLTMDLQVIYEAPVLLQEFYLMRAWVASKDRGKVVAEYDMISSTGVLHNRGKGTLLNFPESRVGQGKAALPGLNTRYSEGILTPLREKYEEQEDRMLIVPEINKISFPKDALLEERFAGWTEYTFDNEFPDVWIKGNNGFVGIHQGRHFEGLEEGCTFILRRFYSPSGDRFAGAIYFSKYCVGPPGIVHGGCLGTAFDAFLADSIFFRRGWGIMTRMLQIKYLRSVPVDTVAYFTDAIILNETPRSFIVKASLVDATGKVYCLGMGEFKLKSKGKMESFETIRDRFGRTSGLSPEENRREMLNFVMSSGKL